MRSKINKVMIFGTFDIVHKGHEYLFKEAKKQADYLIIVIARDQTVLKFKKSLPKNNEQIRYNSIKKLGVVDKVVFGNLGNKHLIIKKYRPDIICLGYDQEFFTKELKNKLVDYNLENTKIIRLKPYKPEKYKSSKLKECTQA